MNIIISSILGGIAESFYLGGKGSFNSSIAIDPDQPILGNIKSSGAIIPVGYSKFSGAGLTGYPKWITTNNKNALIYVYDSLGNFISYTSGLTGEAVLSTISNSTGNGMTYYNDYIYLFRNTDVDRWGPVSAGEPSLTSGVWTGATLGNQTALVNSSYPVLRGCAMPNHSAIVHSDGALYFLDFAAGQGLVHRIITTATGTNNGSAYNVLDLPFGYYPTCIVSYGLDLVIGAIQTSSDTTVDQGKSAIFFWNSIDASFYRKVELQDPIISALLTSNGVLYVFSGNAVNGVRVQKYLGGEVMEQLSFQDEGCPPFAGAVDAIGNKILWGGFTTYPESSASVFSYGSKSNLPLGLHNVARSTSVGTNQNVTSLKIVQQDAGIQPKYVIGWGDGASKGLDKFSSSATLLSVFRSSCYIIGKSFTIKKVRIPLGATLGANMTITPKVYIDDVSSSKTLNIINSTNYSGRQVTLYPSIRGTNNFMLELRFTGTVALPVIMPIIIEIEVGEP